MPAHLHVHSAFSFLDGCFYPEPLLERAAELGYSALALTDHDNLCGAVRFVKTARDLGIKPLLGAEVTITTPSFQFSDRPSHITFLAATKEGYENLCRLITQSYQIGGRRTPALPRESLLDFNEGLIALSGCRRGEVPRLLLAGKAEQASVAAEWYREVFQKRFFIEVQRLFLPGEERLIRGLVQISDELDIPLAATNNIHYLDLKDMPTHDMLTCVRTLTRVDEAHHERPLNAEARFLSPGAFAARFNDLPEAIQNTDRIAEMCDPNVLDISRPEIPRPVILEGEPHEFLTKLVFEGARKRYRRISEKIRSRLLHELDIIGRLNCEEYFLVVWDILREARARGIRTSGRGSVVDSAVGHCLFISDIDPIKNNLLFERFMSLERSQMPDIDVDFPREERDELVTWVQQRYGHDHVGGVCTFNTFRGRSALRDLGKAMGLPLEEIGLLAKRLRRTDADEITESMVSQPQAVHQQTYAKRYTRLFEMCAKVAGLPRMISTHLAGVVITSNPILKYTPLQPSAKGVVRLAHFDKDDIEAIGLKTDLLSLPILGAVDQAKGSCPYEAIPDDDQETFRMIRSGEAIGAFELQSPAQRALHARVMTDSKKDIIDSIALIRPGPVQGGMSENYIRRKLGLEPVTYAHPSLEPSLKHTFGIIVFQEQAIEVACAAANFTPGEADILRKAMTHARSKNAMQKLKASFMEKALENGVSHEAAEKIFKCIAGFAGFGFAEGHARAFGEIAYKSSYLLRHHPAHYMAGLLNNQPMGFYPPNTIVSQARTRGVLILPLDINESDFFATSTDETIRIGFRQIKGLPESLGRTIHSLAPFTDIRDFCRKCKPAINALEKLIAAGAFDSLHLNRRALLWQAEEALRAGSISKNEHQTLSELDVWPDPPNLPDFNEIELMSLEYKALGLTVNCHLVSLLRPKLNGMGLLTTNDLVWMPGGQKVRVGGLTLGPHTPPTQSGKRVLFFCLEDEFGIIDVTVFDDVYKSSGYLAFSEPLLIVEGTLQKRGLGRSILADRVRVIPTSSRRPSHKNKPNRLPEPRIPTAAR